MEDDIVLVFESFALEDSRHCDYDYVLVLVLIIFTCPELITDRV